MPASIDADCRPILIRCCRGNSAGRHATFPARSRRPPIRIAEAEKDARMLTGSEQFLLHVLSGPEYAEHHETGAVVRMVADKKMGVTVRRAALAKEFLFDLGA
jgi:hypothetical protein